METVADQLTQAGLDFETLQWNLSNWAKQTAEQRKSDIEKYVKANVQKDVEVEGGLSEAQQNAANLISRYIDVQNERAPIVESLTEPETGFNAQWNAAVKNLSQLNLNTDLVQNVLDLPAGTEARKSKLEGFIKDFPSRADKINAVIKAYDDYRVVGGRLDDPEDHMRKC
jgi:hypothetical protein